MRMLTRMLGLALLWSLPSLAQTPRPLDSVPKDGQNPAAFVPQGWRIEDTLKGDLNKDNSLDVVVQLVEAGADRGPNGETPDHARMLLVLLESGGKLHRVGASDKILYCTTCAGTLSAPGPGQVKIDKGIILVDQLSGSRETLHTLLRLRYEPKEQRVLLIGEDVTKSDRGTGASEYESTNLLTGEHITEKRQYNERKKKDATLSSKKDKVAVKKQYLEDVTLPEE